MSQWGFYFDQTRCFNCKACVFACKSWNDDKRGDVSLNVPLAWIETGKYDNPSAYEALSGSTGEQNYAEYRKYHMKENWRRVTATEYGDVPPNIDVLNVSIGCNHCDEPACVKACPMQIIEKESKFGAVLVNNEYCISCGKCKDACPWDAPQFYDPEFRSYADADPKRPRMTKCTLCYERISEGLKPACVAACVGRALECGPIEELKAKYPNAVVTLENFASDEIPSMGIYTKPNIIFKARAKKV
ncbi:MAG TPA: hypothetical protein DCM31_05475 [Deferribacteraceae bacterium]|nr:hypothetical protein [Deferribacteraceae bacterium]